MVQEGNWMVHHLSEELAQLMLIQEIIDTHPAHPLLIITLIQFHINLRILILNHAADLLEERA
jgi:hypothetical protein